ncbi:MAG: U32 family peptidase [Desulfobacterales bacterium]|nr:U32 family peptidase [Desulfobacterales bacterium]
MSQKKLELLAPAKNLEYGVAAINHGADAVYIGAGKFGARKAAGNPVADIEKLVAHAHQYHARVYVALNTILYDAELDDARALIQDLWNVGIDALIIQDMGLLEMDLPPVPLFASTQTDNRTLERVRFLEASGFQRVILARELSLKEIRTIRRGTRVPLESFVHGALCVSYSGQCYMSADMGGRSANRGECAQACRLPWRLVDENGRSLEREQYFLSLKDMDRSNRLADLAEAGITSFKIEGRLKDISYVKNITAWYRQKLDALMAQTSEYCRASSGRVSHFFTPDPRKTFYRGGTEYFLDGPRDDIHSFATPKSMGEKLGPVTHIAPDHFKLKGTAKLANGDGLCYLDRKGKLQGFSVNRVDQDRIRPSSPGNLTRSPLYKGAVVFRNHDHQFSKALAGESAQRRIRLDLTFSETPTGFCLSGRDEDGIQVELPLDMEKEAAQKPQVARATLEKQLAKLGSTPFELGRLRLEAHAYFIPTRVLNQLRRDLVAALEAQRLAAHPRIPASAPRLWDYPDTALDFKANVANRKAFEFYKKRGVKTLDPCFELTPPGSGAQVMTLRHCIRYALRQCPKEHGGRRRDWPEPMFLENDRGRYRVETDCKKCEMILTAVD